MVVDDERAVRRLCERMLTKLGCTCVLLEDGDEVAGALTSHGYSLLPHGAASAKSPPNRREIDVILMDIMMARSNGVDIMLDLHARSVKCGATPLPPVYAMTANTSVDDLCVYKEAGFAGVLGKPFSYEQLKSKLLSLAH